MIKKIEDAANVLRRDVLKMTTNAGSGHLTSSLSSAEIISTLFFEEMKYDVRNSDNPENDEFILSKGHAAPILYSALYRAGIVKQDLNTLRKLNSPLEGHPTPRSIKNVKIATGSLGQGPSIGVGMALAGKIQKRNFRVYVLCGDGEIAEGSVYEAIEFAVYHKLNNFCMIVDVNRLGQAGETMLGYDINSYKKRFEGLGCEVLTINGHDVEEILKAFSKARKSSLPVVILAKTIKGKGISFLENKEGFHGKVLDKKQYELALSELADTQFPQFIIKKPAYSGRNRWKTKKPVLPDYKTGEQISTRLAYGESLLKLTLARPDVLAIDGEVNNSTYSIKVKEENPGQFIEMFIAEQNMIGVALGLSKKGFKVFASTFAAFLTRAHDQMRMSAISNGDFVIAGSHAGVSIGEDGASQMGLEDISLFRSIPESIIFYPSDAVSTSKLVELSSSLSGIKYIRTTRGNTRVLYNSKEKFIIGEFKILHESLIDKVVLCGSGITLYEALKAHSELKKKGINSAVIDLYCIKPFNAEKFINFVKKHGNNVIVSEDHYEEGGIGEMLSKVILNKGIKMNLLNVKTIPHSGKPEELLKKYKIDSEAIVEAAKEII